MAARLQHGRLGKSEWTPLTDLSYCYCFAVAECPSCRLLLMLSVQPVPPPPSPPYPVPTHAPTARRWLCRPFFPLSTLEQCQQLAHRPHQSPQPLLFRLAPMHSNGCVWYVYAGWALGETRATRQAKKERDGGEGGCVCGFCDCCFFSLIIPPGAAVCGCGI